MSVELSDGSDWLETLQRLSVPVNEQANSHAKGREAFGRNIGCQCMLIEAMKVLAKEGLLTLKGMEIVMPFLERDGYQEHEAGRV